MVAAAAAAPAGQQWQGRSAGEGAAPRLRLRLWQQPERGALLCMPACLDGLDVDEHVMPVMAACCSRGPRGWNWCMRVLTRKAVCGRLGACPHACMHACAQSRRGPRALRYFLSSRSAAMSNAVVEAGSGAEAGLSILLTALRGCGTDGRWRCQHAMAPCDPIHALPRAITRLRCDAL